VCIASVMCVYCVCNVCVLCLYCVCIVSVLCLYCVCNVCVLCLYSVSLLCTQYHIKLVELLMEYTNDPVSICVHNGVNVYCVRSRL